MKNLILILLIIIVASCSINKDKGEQNVDIISMSETELKCKQINSDEIIVRGAYPFVMIDSLFFLFNGVPSSGALVLREFDAGEVGSFLKKGNGFGECHAPDYAGRKGDTIYVFERSNTKLMSYLFSCKNDSLYYKCIREVRSQKNSEFYFSVCRLENGLYVGSRMSGKDHLFTLLNENLDSITSFGKIPLTMDKSSEKNINFSIFKGDFIVNGNTIYYASNFCAYMAAYEIKSTNNIVAKFEKMYVEPLYSCDYGKIKFDKQNHLRGFNDITYNNDYIYATYDGKSKNIAKSEGASGHVPSKILVFDKYGIPIAKFKTSFKIRDLAVCEQFLYLLDLDCNIHSVNLKHEITPSLSGASHRQN